MSRRPSFFFSRAVSACVASILALACESVARADLHAGDSAPAFHVKSTAAKTISLASLRGKPVYLNFFASWCVPCNAEAPSLAQLAKQFAPRGLTMIGIDEQEDAKTAVAFAKRYAWPFAIGVDDGDMAKNYQAEVLPVHVFIERSGKISTIRFGTMSSMEIAAAMQKIL